MNWVYERDSWDKTRHALTVIGSGLMRPVANIERKNNNNTFLDIRSVRGYLTKSLLGSKGKNVSVGDPGLLASLLVREKPLHRHRIGIIPHHSQVDSPAFREKLKLLGNVTIIDFRTSDHSRIFHEMLECEIILSQSLHGLIFADSLGIPNIWLDTGALHGGGHSSSMITSPL